MNTPSFPEQPQTKPRILPRIKSPTHFSIALLTGIALAFYHGLWLPGLVLIKRDASWFYLPIKQYIIERLSVGEFPQWFPYEAMGRSFIGTTATGFFHPFTALYSLFAAPDAYRLSTLASCLLAAWGAFALGRTLDISRTGALLSGLAFALSGYVVSFTESLVYLYSICVLPFFCAALEKALAKHRAWIAVPAAIWATVFLNGDAQTGYYYGFIALLWAIARAPDFRSHAFFRLTLVAGLATLLASIQLGPTWAVFAGSERASPGTFREEALLWSTHPLRLVTMLAAPIGEQVDPAVLAKFFFDTPVGSVWAESLYLGVPVTGLAFLGARDRRDLRMLLWLGCLTLILSLGRYGGLYQILYDVVPFWSAFRYPEKFMGVVSFAIAMLAGAGVDAVKAKRTGAAPWFIMTILCAGTCLALHTRAASGWTMAHFLAPKPVVQAVVSSAAQAFLFSAVTSLGVGIVVAGVQRETFRIEFLLAALIAFTTLDLSRINLGAYHTGRLADVTFVPPFVEALKAREGSLEPGHFRIVTIERTIFATPPHLVPLLGPYGAEAMERRQALDLEHNAQFHIEAARPYLPGTHAELVTMLKQKIGLQAAARYNVTYYIGRRFLFDDPRFDRLRVTQLPSYDLGLFTNPYPAKPRAYLSQKPERTAVPVASAALLARPDFQDGTVDVIETAGATPPGPAPDGSTLIEHYAPEEVRVRVAIPRSATLVLLDAFDRGWTATLEDGTALPILRANVLVRAVVVPAGTHVVTFSYQTPLLKAGAWVSLAGVFLCLGLIAHAWWKTGYAEYRWSKRHKHGA